MFRVLDCHQPHWDTTVNLMPYDVRGLPLSSAWGRAHEEPGVTAHLAVMDDVERGFTICQPFLKRAIPDSVYFDIAAAGYGGQFTSHPMPAFSDAQGFDRLFCEWAYHSNIVSEFYLLNPVTAFVQPVCLQDATMKLERGATILPLLTDELQLELVRPNRRESLRHGADAAIGTIGPGEFFEFYAAAMERKGAAQRWRLSVEHVAGLKRQMGNDVALLGACDPEGEMRAVAIFCFGQEAAYYHLSATSAVAKSGYADRLIMHGAALARDRGRRWLHLGGGFQDDDGLAAYKRSFGGMIRPVYSVRRIHNGWLYDSLSKRIVPRPGFFPAYRSQEAE